MKCLPLDHEPKDQGGKRESLTTRASGSLHDTRMSHLVGLFFFNDEVLCLSLFRSYFAVCNTGLWDESQESWLVLLNGTVTGLWNCKVF
jgi:hypothetical protein